MQRIALLTLFFLNVFFPAFPADTSDIHPKVLILHSYHKADWTDNILDGIHAVMSERTHVDLYIEYMDTKEFNHPEYLNSLRDTLKEKYKHISFDAVITSDDTAWLFAMEYEDVLFNGAPIVFCGVNNFDPELIRGRKVTGVIEKGDFKPTLDYIFKALPACKQLLVICDRTRTGQINKQNLLEVLSGSFPDIQTVFLEDISYGGLKERLIRARPGKEAAFFISFWQDNTGRAVFPEDLAAAFRESQVPVFGRSEWMINRGMTGGKCVSGFNQGMVAARLAKQIIDSQGKTIPPVILDSPNQFMFDCLELKKHSLSLRQLPEDALLFNKPPSFSDIYHDYKIFIWISTALLLLLVISVIFLIIDTMKRRLMEKALRRSQKNLQVTLQSIGDAVITTDNNSLITNMNAVAENLTGWKLIDAAGKLLDEVLNIIDSNTRKKVPSPYTQVMKSGRIMALPRHTVLISRDGRHHMIADSGAPIRDEKNNVLGVVLVFRDITEEFYRQQERAHSQRMDSIGRLAGGIAHDFNNMLSGIFGSVELLKLKLLNADEEILQLLSIISKSCQQAAELTRKLLTFSRKGLEGAGNRDLHKLINDSMDILSRTLDRKIELIKELHADDHIIFCDGPQIQNAILNLGLNARDAMPKGGRITIETSSAVIGRHDDTKQPELKPGKYIVLKISDTGTGIHPQDIGKVFEPFFTTKETGKGTGLGLSTVYNTVKEHNGKITVMNLEEGGTAFQIFLPVVDAPEDTINTEKATKRFKGKGTVLLIDDEDNIRQTTSKLLETMGFEVILAENGKQGVEKYNEHINDIVLVITDVIMPVMNGTDCLLAIKAINPDARVILSSGYVGHVDTEKMSSTHASGFLRKPYFRQQLENVLTAVMGEGS